MDNLEQLLEDPSIKEGKERISKAVAIAEREWKKIGESLSLCGDIGDFSKKDFMIGVISEDIIIKYPKISLTKSVSGYSPTYYPIYFIDNLLKMDEQMEDKGYGTTEASYAYVELVTKAMNRLGLEGVLGAGYGCGYSNVRTGWIVEKGLEEERLMFTNMFFSKRAKRYDWDFHWSSVKEDLKSIYDKFLVWNDNPQTYIEESKPRAIVKPFIV